MPRSLHPFWTFWLLAWVWGIRKLVIRRRVMVSRWVAQPERFLFACFFHRDLRSLVWVES